MQQALLPTHHSCAYCGADVPLEPEYTIHRDGLGEGPEVPLCSRCGDSDGPSCAEIWERIAEPRLVPLEQRPKHHLN